MSNPFSGAGLLDPGSSSCPYSSNVLDGVFSEVQRQDPA
jgi:hypothetical protein